MRLLEHQAKRILASWGVLVPGGALVTRPSQLASAVRRTGPSAGLRAGKYPVVLKAQVYAGGRGKAGGIVRVRSLAQAKAAAKRMLGSRLVTAQTSPAGVPVKSLWVEEGVEILKECYVSILIDRSRQAPVVVAAREGGMAIEELAEKHPDAIRTTAFDPLMGLLPHQARRIVGWLGIPREEREKAAQQLVRLAHGFFSTDASLVEVNPWALIRGRGMLALDAKLTVDDSALFRHPELERMKTQDADSASEAESRRIGISYVGLDGSIGCMVNGAGLAMATMDLIKLHGGEPANFLDVGGGADVTQVREAFKLILADQKVKAILVNIFGGIMKCDVIAAGIIGAARTVKIQVPLVVRLEGTNVEQGRKMLEASKLGLLTAAGMDEAAEKVVAAAR
ncbi:MAG: ADP-forming succinate--CoA ligase subunit beta [Candidatus Omnitrophica bacterium]|nr:ADP-forming succinate--CoA ligase subunit beta [Candidatus Omnitrophota bacterium]